MQGGRCITESFHNVVDLNQPSVFSTSNVNNSTKWFGNLLTPGRQDTGKSISVAQDQVYGGDLTLEKDFFAPTSASLNRDALHRHQPEHSGVHSEGGSNHGGNHVTKMVLNLSLPGSDYCPRNKESRGAYMGNSESLTYGLSLPIGGASSSTSGDLINNGDMGGSSLILSGKRKAPEVDDTQLYTGRSSSSHLQSENNVAQRTVSASQNVSGSIATAASPMEWSFTSQPEQLNLRLGIGERETYSEFFPPPNITDIAESVVENNDARLNVGQQEPNFFTFPFTDATLRPSGSSSGNQPSRSFGATDAALIINLNNPVGQSHEINLPENAGCMQPPYWSGSLDPQTGRPLKSLRFSGGRSTASPDVHNSIGSLRNRSDFSASDTTVSRHSLQGSPAFNLASGSNHISESSLPSSRSGSDVSMQNIRTGSLQNWTGPNQRGVTQYSPQLPFQPPLQRSLNQRGHHPVMPPTLSFLAEGVIPSLSSQGRQNHSSGSALLIGEHSDPTSRQHGLAVNIEARQRLVRQVRNTMQRGVNRRTQNVTIGVAALHDRHRDMRLDIDNMSYEELLALEDRIGNVCTGLSDKVIMRSMKRRKHLPMKSEANFEPCCICQEEFVAGDDIGATACEHEFHFKCIKQWLSVKNSCPICKKTGLET